MEQPGIVYSLEVQPTMSMECHSLHKTETMTITVQHTGREDGGTDHVWLHNSMASTTMTQHQEPMRLFIGKHSLDLVVPSSLLK